MAIIFSEVYAVPGDNGIIDVIHPATGLSGFYGETEAELRVRHPLAARMSWVDWEQAVIARQTTPIEWLITTASEYNEMLNVLPPIAWAYGAFLVGEPTDHDVATRLPRYQAYRQIHDAFFASSRPITVTELRTAVTP